jgi:MSHA pilin protein MshD
MNTGQTILTAGAMMLLSILVLRVGSSTLVTQDSMYNSKFGILAISLASSFLEQATQKAFDEATKEDFVTSINSLTLKSDFGAGKEAGEHKDSLHTYDDFDDFHEYTNVDSTMPSALFKINCTVNYVNPSISGFISTDRTWHKMMTVTVTSPSMKDTVTLNKVFSYWKLP